MSAVKLLISTLISFLVAYHTQAIPDCYILSGVIVDSPQDVSFGHISLAGGAGFEQPLLSFELRIISLPCCIYIPGLIPASTGLV